MKAQPFTCTQCGASQSKWAGQCPDCSEWNTIIENEQRKNTKKTAETNLPQPIGHFELELVERIPSTIGELDSTLGGGLVPGSVVLIGGEPGIGKSTLLLQAAAEYAKMNLKVLYCSGEESCSQIAMRGKRLGIQSDNLFLISETNIDSIEATVVKERPNVIVLDSIQTLQSEEAGSQPGTVGQLRECTHRIVALAKGLNIPVFIVGHVTKEGNIAGPKILEHMVDVVLYFEGSSSHTFRILRTIKNRFGSTNDVGVFEMRTTGIFGVEDPSQLFLSERQASVSGSAICACVEGSRPLLIEVQALVSQSSLAMPRRTAIGVDHNRVSLLVAILEKRAGFKLFDQDVYVNIAGGIRLSEPAIDLSIIAAMISSFQGKSIEAETVFFGEIGLSGETRTVPRSDIRLKEAVKIGMSKVFLPPRTAKELQSEFPQLELVPIEHIGMLCDYI